MNIKTLATALTAALMLCSCRTLQTEISGRFIGSEATHIYLEEVTPLREHIIDTAAMADDGSFSFRFENENQTPMLYNLVCNDERIPLLVAAGDRITLNSVGSLVRNYTVEGSEESDVLRKFYQNYVTGARNLDRLAERFGRPQLTDTEREELAKAYTEEYYRIRREQLRFIVENKQSLAAVYALYQRLPGDIHLFNGDSDVVYFRTVAEAVAERWPESPYVKSLEAEIERMDARIALSSQITEASYPDLEMQDIYGRKIRLSSLAGKVILLDFWSAELGNSNVYNAELKGVYEKYRNAATPLEVYQVAIDTSKPLWIGSVQEQQLPWISVSDLRGRASTALALYNVAKLPANFLIDAEGNIVARDLYGKSLEERLETLTR